MFTYNEHSYVEHSYDEIHPLKTYLRYTLIIIIKFLKGCIINSGIDITQ